MERSFRDLTEEEKHKYHRMKQYYMNYMSKIVGDRSIQGFEIGSLIRKIGNMYDTILNFEYEDFEISIPRLIILMQLYINGEIENNEKMTPTNLSHFQNVNKNTISSLINGLESQGLVVREADVNDRRIVRLKITDAGQEVVRTMVPQQMDYMNEISSELTDVEKDQLIELLTKLLISLKHRSMCLRRDDVPQNRSR